MASALLALKACCLIIWLLHCSPTWGQENNLDQFDLHRFPWESLPSTNSDLVFLLDRSGSVGMAGFEMQLGFVDRFLKYFDVAPNATRVAVISFSDDAEVHADFLKEPGNKCQLGRRMREAKYSKHYATNTGAGLREVREVFLNSRPQAHKVLVLVTDGLATIGPDPVEEANKLKEAGVEVYVFGIGRSFRKHLDSLATSEKHVFEFESFAEFESFDKDGPTDRWSVGDNPRDCDSFCRRSLTKGPDGSELGSCCDKNAVCGCSLKSGLSKCLCKPGFYGGGHHGQCTPCKPDTYKNTSDSGPCLSCPPHSRTAHEGSKSVKECACDEGYVGNPGSGVPCSVVTCPPLQPPEHGRILECNNSYEGECLFQCHQHYETDDGQDTHLRMCDADGTWSGATTVCKAKSCGKPQDLKNGYVTGCNSPWKVNDTCTFHCDHGYELRGSSATRACDEWKSWTGEDVYCEPVQCPSPPDVQNAIVGAVLASKVYRFGEYFNPRCPQGFNLRGPPVLFCNAQGQWDSGNEDHSKMACIDESKPTISCPPNIVNFTETHKASALVQWAQPSYKDNSGGKLVLQQMPGNITSPHRFEVGSHTIQFRVVDAAGQYAICSFTITVLDKEDPQVLWCPRDISLETAEDDVTVTWKEPSFKDNSGSVQVKPNHAPGSKFGHGIHKVTYNAHDRSGNIATCIFRVTVSKSKCPFYPAPLNGALSCDHWLHGQFCQPLCNDQFDFLEEPAEMYVCAKDRRWYTEPEGMPVPWPDCARRSWPEEARKKYHAFYYSGDCHDPEVQKTIKRAFEINFNYVRNRLTVCTNSKKCRLSGVTVRCGDMSELVGRPPKMRIAKRSVGLGTASTAGVDAEVILEFRANGTSALGNDTEELAAAIDEIVDSIGEISPSVLEQVSGEENVTVQMDLIDSSAEDVVIVCADGETLSGQGCAKCPKGTHHDRSRGVCSPCPTGSYQDEEGTVSCKLCPEGAATAAPKSSSVDDCQLVCSPGTFSKDGLQTCLACPLGTYQDKRQQTRCKRCPTGSTTEAFGSSQETDCKKYCAPGSYSDSGLQPCTPCKRGTYQALSGQKSCSECPAPTTSLHEGSTSTFDCVDFDHCASNPCHNKTCIAHQHGFNCGDE